MTYRASEDAPNKNCAAIRVAYLQGRPWGHSIHSAFAESVSADFFYFDRYLPYHLDYGSTLKSRRLLSWMLNALLFPAKDYDVVLTEEPYHTAYWIKATSRKSRKPKLVSIVASHIPYFAQAGRLSSASVRRLVQLCLRYDGLICPGEMLRDVLLDISHGKLGKKIRVITNSPDASRMQNLLHVTPSLHAPNIVTIAAAQNEARCWYKGIDLMVAAFTKLCALRPDVRYTIVGEVDPSVRHALTREIPRTVSERIVFRGSVSELGPVLGEASLYWHLARGDAWGISVNEAMLAGLPAIVSIWTGARQIVQQVSPSLVLPLDVEALVERTIDYFDESSGNRSLASARSREVASTYTRSRSISEFREAWQDILASTS